MMARKELGWWEVVGGSVGGGPGLGVAGQRLGEVE